MVHTLGDVPHAVPPAPPCDSDRAAEHEALEHHHDVAIAVPARRLPRDNARVGDVARHERPVRGKSIEHIVAELPVVIEPPARRIPPRKLGHLGPVERQVTHGSNHETQLEERILALESANEVVGLVIDAEPAPEHEVGCRRDRGRRFDLHKRQLAHHLDEVSLRARVEQLGAHGDPARLGEAQRDRL